MTVGPLTAALQAHVARGDISGAALRFRRQGELAEDAAVGWADIAGAQPVSPRSVFRLASLTKPVIAVAIMQFVEQGRLRLDDPVGHLIPAYGSTSVAHGASVGWDWAARLPDSVDIVAAARGVTIRDLLTHSSGLGQGPFSHPLINAASRPDQSLAARVDMYAGVPGDDHPGASAGYSPQVGFDVLGRIVEILADADLQTALRDRVLDPLGMVDTTFVLTADQRDRLVTLYRHEHGALQDDNASEGARAMQSTPAGPHSGAAGLFSTVADYDRFAQALAAGGTLDGFRILNPASVAALSQSRSTGARTLAPGLEWGLGVVVAVDDLDYRAPGAWGWSGAWGSHLVVDPRNQTTLTLMINRSDIGGADSAISRELERIALATYGCRR
ncbi:serine hydrolase domain-containing protein [Microbacterium sp. QXD-8]|uniref:Serine hydrolase domain-containing protein n=1 Tax=Microbacterium psychrotolerans TaxID=3068321 RepID=A0ABU0YW39_9MICO|nr:serine hydrolase domain-containing protein [Microbacterium sp. QXD-8]MDQ7876548.1 serine hydrolase domain-containing protein [Microbacterium sp. QXD-8]